MPDKNPYQSPKSSLEQPHNPEGQHDGPPIAIYSPMQVFMGSFWGGPFATVYFLRANYKALGKNGYANQALALGAVFIIVIMFILPFLPENIPNTLVPFIYCAAAGAIAAKTQLEKDDIKTSKVYTFASNWKIFGIGALTLILFFIITLAELFLLDELGIIQLV